MQRAQRDVSRRQVVRAVPLLALFLFAGCEVDHPDYLTARRKKANAPAVPPTDDDELVPADESLTPVNTGDAPPRVPNASWEARVRQLEADQARVYGAVFGSDAGANGIMAGKERSHVPRLELAPEGTGPKRVTVLVEHVMGGKTGAMDAGSDGRPSNPPAADAASDAIADATADAAAASTKDATAPLPSSETEHYITTIYLRAVVAGKETVVGLWELAATDPAPAAVTFTLPEGIDGVVAFEWCTMHGLWKSDPLPLK